MARGAKQKSNIVLLASGSKHARKREPKMAGKIGPPPNHFDGVALETWKMLVKEMSEAKTIYQVDRVGLEALCMAHERLRNSQKLIREHGEVYEDPENGKLLKNPACTVETAANAAIKSFICELGLTPASRGKVQAAMQDETNPFDQF